ncbi:MAG: hypothetical protein OXF50_11605 [Caldilineaceae bacterium]|nr:hypothetical protein [Caldilineaceae bacterium]
MKWLVVGLVIMVIPFVAYLSWPNIESMLNPRPTHVPISVYCINKAEVKEQVDLLKAKVIDSDEIKFAFSYTSRPTRRSDLRRVKEVVEGRSDEFYGSIQEYGFQFTARKRGDDRDKGGGLNVYMDDESCTILHYILRW